MIRLMSLFEGASLLRGTFQVHLHEHQDDRFRLFDLDFEVMKLPHAENHGLRFTIDGTRVAFTGDCEFCPLEVEFLRGVDLAVIDAGHLKPFEITRRSAVRRARSSLPSMNR